MTTRIQLRRTKGFNLQAESMALAAQWGCDLFAESAKNSGNVQGEDAV